MKPSYALIVLTLAIGIAIGIFIQSDSQTPAIASKQKTTSIALDNSAAVNPGQSDLVEFNRLLQNEIKQRKLLEQKVDDLSDQLASLGIELTSQNSNPVQQLEDNQTDDAEPDNDWFNEQALINSGMSSSQANELKVFFEQQELQRLYLRDQSIREGWDRQKYRDEIEALADTEDALRDRLGEQGFDAYLYASGQSNRVAVSSVLATAPAGEAGIQAGDHILRYDNQRVYSGFELRQATTTGNDNESVAVEVERDGEIIEFYLPRGPLGIRMNSVSISP